MKPPRLVGILNEKGGAGKSTVTLLLTLFLRYLGHKVLILDTDPSGWASLLLSPQEHLEGIFDTEVNPKHKRESILGLVEAYLNDEDVVELFSQSIRISTLLPPDDPFPIRYIPPSENLDEFLFRGGEMNDAFRLALLDVAGSLPALFRNTIILLDSAPNDLMMQWAAYNISGFPGGAFIPMKYSIMDIQGGAKTVDVLKQLKTPILGILPIGDRQRKTDREELENLSSLHRVLPPIPDSAVLSTTDWVNSLHITLRALPALHAMCEILGINSRTPELHAQVEESRGRGYLDVRVPLSLLSAQSPEN